MEECFGLIFFSKNIKQVLDRKIKSKSKIIKYIKGIVATSVAVQIVIMPIMVYNYKTISLTFFIANILTSFLITFIIILGFAIILISFTFLELAKVIAIPYEFLIKLLLAITEITSKIPFSKVYVKTPYIYQIVFYYAFISIIRILTKK